MSSPVCYAAASMCLASFSVLKTLTTKGPLVDSSIFSAAKRHAKVLQLGKRDGDIKVTICCCEVKRQYLPTVIMTDGHESSPPLQPQELALSCNGWHPGLPANQIPSLCHKNATSSHLLPCSPELHWSHPVDQINTQISKKCKAVHLQANLHNEFKFK